MDILEIEATRKYGYARVSSKSQEENSSLQAQHEEFLKQGVPKQNIRTEVVSGTNEIKSRPVFSKLLAELKPNDLLIVTKMDRCSRSTLEFLKLQDVLHKKNVVFVVMDLPTSCDLATNKLIAITLSGIAEFETMRRKQRQQEGIEIAKQRGKYVGRKSIIDKKLIDRVRALKEDKHLSVSEIAKLLTISRPTIYKILKNELNYSPIRLTKIQKSTNK